VTVGKGELPSGLTQGLSTLPKGGVSSLTKRGQSDLNLQPIPSLLEHCIVH